MHYVTSPLETVNKMNKLLVDYEKASLIVGDILMEIGMSREDPDDPGVAQRIGQYLVEHEGRMKKLYTDANPKEKNEIVRIYKKYMPHHAGFASK